jgi:hypothetical protein
VIHAEASAEWKHSLPVDDCRVRLARIFRIPAVALPVAAGLCALPLVMAGEAIGATLTNLDADPFVVIVTEGGNRTELTVRPGETLEFCFDGCFVALPNGNRAAISGGETIEISGGKITAK